MLGIRRLARMVFGCCSKERTSAATPKSYAYEPDLGVDGVTLLSLPDNETGSWVDNHHPGVSGDREFVVYLETSVDENMTTGGCYVHIYAVSAGDYERVQCPVGMSADVDADLNTCLRESERDGRLGDRWSND